MRTNVDLEKVNSKWMYRIIKRIIDVLFSIVVLILLIIPSIFIGLAIWTGDMGPIFYSQKRVGIKGKEFKMLKFRTMVPNADQMKKDLMEKNEFKGAMFKIQDDPRVTKVGHFLRRHGIDELPQFWNVLIGDMSLIGPRPPLPEEVDQYVERDFQRLLVKPGITGLWQITPRIEYSFEEMLALDIKYINEQSLFMDLKIIIKTIMIIIKGNN